MNFINCFNDAPFVFSKLLSKNGGVFLNLCADKRSLGKAQLLQFMDIGVKGLGVVCHRLGWASGERQ